MLEFQLNIRRARGDEVAAVMAVIEDGKRSIARLGIEQWQHGYPDAAAIEDDIAAGACWVAESGDGKLLGTHALLFGADEDYEASDIAWLNDGCPYAAIHRCATAADALGHGVMSALFAHAQEVARERAVASIRIDTHPGNTTMRAFLGKQGFTELEAFDLVSHGVPADRRRIAFEKLL